LELIDKNRKMQTITSISGVLGSIFALGFFVADILIAVGVFRDATARKNAGKPLVILTPGYWSFICLVSSLAGLALYWVVHYSTFCKTEGEPTDGRQR
jgi:hypothetical protein